MNNSYFFIAFLLCIALALTFFFPPVTLAQSDVGESGAGSSVALDSTPTPDWIRANVKRCAVRYVETYARTSLFLPNVDPGLALALTMGESNCDRWAKSSAGAIGLMQVVPKAWTASEKALYNPITNIERGMFILSVALNLADQDPVLAIALYNCSEWAVYADRCGPYGGKNFGRYVLAEWLPVAQDVLDEIARDDRYLKLTWISILYTWGYGVNSVEPEDGCKPINFVEGIRFDKYVCGLYIGIRNVILSS